MTRQLLNNIDHQDLTVAIRHGAAFGDSVNQLMVFPTEFEDVQREFPILFTRDGEGALKAVALLGLDRDENLFLGEQGWESRYIPAIQQRGPFSIGMQRGDSPELMIHVDTADPRVGAEDGLPLFLPHGGNAPYLEHIARVLRTIYAGLELTGAMFAAFEEAGLLQPVDVEIMLSDTERYDLNGYFTLAQERLAELDGATLERLNREGLLNLAFLAIASLANVNRLIELKNRRRGAE